MQLTARSKFELCGWNVINKKMSSRKTRFNSQIDDGGQRRSTLMASLEKAMNDIEGKLDLVVDALNAINDRFITVHEIINQASDGLDPRIDVNSEGIKDNAEKVEALEQENKQLKKEAEILKGIIFKYDTEIASMRDKLTRLTAKSMAPNIIISSIDGDSSNAKEDNCKEKVSSFLKNIMGIDHKTKQIQVAHRVGESQEEKTDR